jgi:hypothetical protein
MADSVPHWDELSDGLVEAFGWAHASEREDVVGTRALLIGIIRAGEGSSEPDQLLQFINLRPQALYKALQGLPGLPSIDPYVSEPSRLKGTPLVTKNVKDALRTAREMQHAAVSDRRLDATHVFGALLEMPSCTAYRGLEIALNGRLSILRVGELYRDYLHRSDESSFEDVLREDSASEPSSGGEGLALRDSRVDWQSDTPARADLLGRHHLARTLAKRLARMSQENPDDSFMLHLDGPWGAGKSTLLGFIEKDLGKDWLIVEFDAWRQSRIGPPWWALLTSLRKAMCDDIKWPERWRLRASEAFERLRRDHTLPPFLLLLALAAIVFAVTRPASNEIRGAAALASAAVAGFTLLWTAGRTIAQFLLWESATGAQLYERSDRNPMERLAVHFAWLISHARRHVIFFVEDLDRCDERYVVDLLDSIQTLVRDTPGRLSSGREPYFIVAADGRWIRRSYEQVYASFDDAVSEPGRPLGYLFLDKIFQLTAYVPAIGAGQQAGYLSTLLGSADRSVGRDLATELTRRRTLIEESENQEEILSVVNDASPAAWSDLASAALERLSEPEVERVTEHDLLRFTALLERNPRSMKRFINAFSVALSTALLEGRSVNADPLALWTILRLRWPDLADHLRKHPDDIDALADPNQTIDTADDWLAQLSTDGEVRDLATFDDGVLSSDNIRLLTGTEKLEPERPSA